MFDMDDFLSINCLYYYDCEMISVYINKLNYKLYLSYFLDDVTNPRYLLAEVTREQILCMVEDKLPIYDILSNSSEYYIFEPQTHKIYPIQFKDVDQSALPEKDVYLYGKRISLI